MPTGYTAELMEKGQTFEQFAMTCARAFGACIEMRDEPLDAPIPEAFGEPDYHSKEIGKARAEVERLAAMSPDERLAFGVAKKVEAIASANNYLAKEIEENARLTAVRDRVQEWEPPTPDHVGLKTFMLEQIGISLHSTEYSTKTIAEANAKEPLDFYADAVSSAEWMLTYHEEGKVKDSKRTADRNTWLQKLRESITHSDEAFKKSDDLGFTSKERAYGQYISNPLNDPEKFEEYYKQSQEKNKTVEAC